MKLSEVTFICVDCESTGLDPKKDRIIEVAATRFTLQQNLLSFESLVDPECEIPQASQEIHKITLDMVKGKPKIRDLLPELLTFINGYTVIGHGVYFDMEMIAEEARRAHLSTSILSLPFIDTLRLARLYGESPVNSLESLRQHFNIAAEGAHRAMNDVLVNIEVFKYLTQGYKTIEQIMQVLSRPIKLRTMPLGKHKGRRFDEIPLEYLIWAERKNFDQDLLFSIRSEIAQRKRGGGFEQASNPFAHL